MARKIQLYACVLLSLALLACSRAVGPDVVPREEWKVVFSAGQIATVRETFPDFEPPKVEPTVSLSDPAKLTGYVFEPARFFGAASPKGYRQLASGALVETNGYDCPVNLQKNTGTYFDLVGNKQQFALQVRTIDPRNQLRGRMGLPALSSHNSPLITADYGRPCADIAEIQDVIAKTKEALAAEFPEIASVSEIDVRITLEPTIFWVIGSNFGDTWAGGVISKDGSQFAVRVILFYISNSDFRIADWREFLVWEMTNYYLLKIGKPEFVF